MKILYLITQSELGGAQKYVSDLANHFSKENDVLVCSGKEDAENWLKKNTVLNKVKYHELKYLKRDISPINDIKAFFEIRKIIRNFQPDIIHLNSTKISILGSLAPVLLFKSPKIIYTAHGWVFNEKLGKTKRSFYKFLEKNTVFLKDRIICVSDFDKKSAENIGINNKKLKTIYNGISQSSYLEKNKARNKISKYINHSLGEKDIIIGSIGNLYNNKGFAYLFDAIKKTLKNNYSFKLIIIGEGKEREKLQKIIEEDDLQKNIFLAGKIKNASTLLKAFDMYINSSIKEGLSYTILEAMQAELPIIVSDVGGNSEMIEDNINGLIFESKNTEDLSNKISYLLDNKNKADLFSLNSREKLKQFDKEVMLRKTLSIYKSLTQK